MEPGGLGVVRHPFRPVRCAIYTRQSVSRPESAELSSCTVQRELCEKYIAAHALEGWFALPERFDDEGLSGGTLERPAFVRLCERIRGGSVDRVVIYRFDRLTRSLADWVKLLEMFERHEVNLSMTTGDLGEPHVATGKLMLNLLATFSEFERGLIRERLRDARAAKRQRGLRSAGLVPFGFASKPATRQLVPVTSECNVVMQVFEKAATGSKPAPIAAWLNQQGITTKKSGSVGGKSWTARAVLRLIQNRVYLGEIGGTRAAHDAVVDAGLFEKANAAVSARRTRTPGRRKLEEPRDPFLLRGQLRCARCGRLMTTASGKPKHKRAKPPRYYRCRGLGACRGNQVSAGEIETRVVGWLQSPKRGELSAEAAFVLSTLRSIWRVLRPRTLRSVVQQFVWEVRWDASHDRIEVMLDDVAVHEQAEELRRVRDEQASG